MPTFRIATALLLCGTAAAHAQQFQQIQPVIDRPLTLAYRAVDVTLHGTYTNWVPDGSNSADGETLAFGVDFGATDRIQLGLATVLPVNPGAAFGSVLGSAMIATPSSTAALRVDFGYENYGVNGNNSALFNHLNRFFGGFGAPLKIPITPTLAFVSGRSGAVQFGHFNNIGSSGTGVYSGASQFTETSSDFLVVSGGDGGTILGINLPAGLLLQPDPHFAITFQAGYSTIIDTDSSGSLHFIPVGLEAILTPAPRLDIGARFFIDGKVAETGNVALGAGYFDLRELMFWTRVHL
ncbi:MAG TPA: hypothetical protein VE620_07320 [Myxococcales bacterium]|nr:hypothetical protein [Myxococcales bacterium]